ncbi:DUF4012 domain-containing protein [Rarobacter incanus]|nr:DUF4012 domain-containing protein [Rarobacter incanus]
MTEHLSQHTEPSAPADQPGFFRRHRTGTIVTVALVAFFAFLGYSAVQYYSVARNLQDLNALVDVARAHAKDSDVDALADDLVRAHTFASRASSAADSIPVRLGEKLPGIGDDVRAIRVTSHVAADLTGSTSSLTALLPRITGTNLAGGGEGFDLTLLASVRESLSSIDTAATTSAQKLKAVSTDGVNPQIKTRIDKVSSALTGIGPAVRKLEPYMDALPIILGDGGKRTWFVTMQNLTEVRPSGGLLSAYIILEADNGKLNVATQGSNDDLVAGPAVPYQGIIPAGYVDAWGSETFTNWLSMNLSANFPDNAKLIRAGWNARGETQVDSVLSLGQGTLPYLAAAVGPLSAGDKQIAPQDLTEYLTVGVYKDYSNPKEKDAVVGQMIAEMFTKLSQGQIDLASLVSTTLSQETADYLQLWSSDPIVQKDIASAGFSGEFPATPGPSSTVRVINAGGNKLDAFMHLGATYELGACTIDADADLATRTSTFTVTITNDAPTSGLPPYMTGRLDVTDGTTPTVGSNHDYVVVYAPVDATFDSFRLNGQDAFVSRGEADGREFVVYDVELEPGETKTLTTQWDEPARDDDDRDLPTDPQIVMQPLLNEPNVKTVSQATCK